MTAGDDDGHKVIAEERGGECEWYGKDSLYVHERGGTTKSGQRETDLCACVSVYPNFDAFVCSSTLLHLPVR